MHGLNPDQLDAVVHTEGPLLVVAGAGSGKTRVLTHRIAHLIDQGVRPSNILAITFTNKAAAEMRERVGALVGPVVRAMWVSTFHSACVRILRRDAEALGYPRTFSIYDQADAVRLTGYVIRDLGLDPKRFTPRGVHGHISLWKNELTDPDQAAAGATDIFARNHAKVYAEYQNRLHRAGAMDFDDLLINVVRLFREHPDVLEHYRQRFEHILVDEYQDTNQAQNEIVLLLAGGHQNICVVGDTDQCLPAGTLIDTPNGPCPDREHPGWRFGVRRQPGSVATGGDGRPCSNRSFRGRRRQGVGRRSRSCGNPRAPRADAIDCSAIDVAGVPHVPRRSWMAHWTHGRFSPGAPGPREARPVRADESGTRRRRLDPSRVPRPLAEAAYWESWFAAEYGIPTVCFHDIGRGLVMDEAWLQRLYDSIDTETRAKALFVGRTSQRRLSAPSSAERRTTRDRQSDDVLRHSCRRRLSPRAVVVESR